MERNVSDIRNIDVWDLLFNQTPTVLRWALGVLTLGVFTLASVLYRWHRADMKEMHDRVDRLEARMDQRHAETNRYLIEIAQNTRKGD
jgi:hypothetical protein